MQLTISVVHLIWMPYGIQLFKNFIDSYKLFDAGYPHELVLLFNGIADENDAIEYRNYIRNSGIDYQAFYYKNGQDLEAYRWVANLVSSEYILFVNSYSKFLAEKWLHKYVQGLSHTNVALVGATGSWQSYYSTYRNKFPWKWNNRLNFKENIDNYKLKLKAMLVWRFHFQAYPNPHIRTNAFMINRDLFLSLKYKNPSRKFDAYTIESGKNSITRQVIKRGLNVLVISKYDRAYEVCEWKTARIFWVDNQENLLISDNQTRYYDYADINERKYLTHIAWGE